MGITTGIVLFDGAEELDFVGPWEVFTMGRREGDTVVTIAEHDRPIVCAKGMRVLRRPHLRRRAAARRRARPGRPRPPGRAREPGDARLPPPGRARLHLGDERVHRRVRARGAPGPSRTTG